ncbi:hypothetical protein AB2B38_005345 [Balneola sp. MJW-20]|uniref:hypothetical protein n=1 Tax=Gracilimonas aurantiaca TaxID=3234185 RepID=UPI00346717B5
MNKLLTLLLLMVPGILMAQNEEPVIVQNVMIGVLPGHGADFRTGMAEHNKTFHAGDAYGCRVYSIANGENTGKYIWSMVSTWSAMDNRPSSTEHDDHWDTKVAPHLMPMSNASYWQWNQSVSTNDDISEISMLRIWWIDLKPTKQGRAMELLEMIKEVYDEKMPDEHYGVYSNTMPSTTEGRDMAIVGYMTNFAEMNEQEDFVAYFNEVHGSGSFTGFITEWWDLMEGEGTEMWIYDEALSGLGPQVNR